MVTLFGWFGFWTSSLDLVDLVEPIGGVINPGSTLYIIHIISTIYIYTYNISIRM